MKTIIHIWDNITTILVTLVAILAMLFVGVRIFGLQVYTVMSGSMEPDYPTGSLIYVKNTDYTELQAGDVITFLLDEDTVATHRIIDVIPDEGDPDIIRYCTKGDANKVQDGMLVNCKNILGVPILTIPKLGYVANWIQHPPGNYAAVFIGVVLTLMVFLPDIFESEEETPQKAEPERKKKKGGKYLRT